MSHLPPQKMIPLKTGMSLYWVPVERRTAEPCLITVVSVGRKWATLSNHLRVDVQTGEVERQKYGHPIPGVYLANEAEYLEFLEKSRLWAAIRRKVEEPLEASRSVASLEAILKSLAEA